MRIRKFVRPLFWIALILMISVSCGRVKSDAKKAAKYTEQSLIKTNQMKMKDAEKYFLKSQQIIQKYESHKKADKFYDLYQQYRDEGK